MKKYQRKPILKLRVVIYDTVTKQWSEVVQNSQTRRHLSESEVRAGHDGIPQLYFQDLIGYPRVISSGGFYVFPMMFDGFKKSDYDAAVYAIRNTYIRDLQRHRDRIEKDIKELRDEIDDSWKAQNAFDELKPTFGEE